ncbi:MAG: KEOPS complex subunit Pcc1 [Halobacteriaceae archaeon]
MGPGRNHQTTLVFTYADASRAATVAAAVGPEAGDIEGDRTRATVESGGDSVTVRIDAADLTALRAGVNTWCSLVEAAEGSARAAERLTADGRRSDE